MNRHAKVKEIRSLCEEVHREGGWDNVPWSPNKQVLCLEAIEAGHALFSLYADYIECKGTVTSIFRVPIDECTFGRLREETEMGIGYAVAERTQLTKISERPTTFNMHMDPNTPGAQGPSGGASLPLARGLPVGETLGGMDGMSYSGTDKDFHSGGFHSLPVAPKKSGMNVHEYHLPGRAPIDSPVRRIPPQEGKKEATVDFMSTSAPPARRQPLGTPEYNETGVAPTNALSRTNIHNVMIPELGSAGTIDPNVATGFAKGLKREVNLGGKHGLTMFDEHGIKVLESVIHKSIQDPRVSLTTEEAEAVREWYEADVFTAENGDDFVDQAFRVRDEVMRVTGWNESTEPWLEAWRTTLDEQAHPALTSYDIAPENHRREEMGRKDYRHAIAVIVKEGRYVLMGKAIADDDRDGYWCFPGGGIDADDGSDPVAAAIREAYEEAGIKVTSKGVILDHPDKPTCAFVVCEYAERPDREPQPNQEFRQFMWLDYDVRYDSGFNIYPQNKAVLEQIPKDALYALHENAVEAGEALIAEVSALKRQKANKRAWAVSSNSRRITTGVNSEPDRRSKAGSSDKTQDSPSDTAVSATQGIKGKHTLSSPSAPQDSAEKLHFQSGAKSPRKAAGEKQKEMDRVKSGRDPAALKPGDAGRPGKADAEKEATGGQLSGAAKKPSGGGAAPGGAQKPAGGPSLPAGQPAGGMDIDALIQAAQAVLAAYGPQAGGAAPAGAAPSPGGAAPAPDAAPPAPGGAAPAAPAAKKPAAKGKNGNGKAGKPTADASPSSKKNKDKATKAQSPGASTPTQAEPQVQQPGQATPPGQIPEPQQPAPAPQQAQQPQPQPGQAPQPGQPPGAPQSQAQPGQQTPPDQPGMQQSGQPQPIQPTGGMPPGQPGVPGDMTAPGMQPQQPQGMPAFQQRVVDLVLKDRGNAEKAYRWLQALGFAQISTPDHTTVQVIAQTHEEMFLVQRTAKVFGLEMAGLLPQ